MPARRRDPNKEAEGLTEDFIALASAGNTEAAARMLGRARTAVIPRIRRLETLLGGDPLILTDERSGFRLTLRGQELAARCTTAWREYTVVRAHALAALRSPSLRVAATGVCVRYELPTILSSWRVAHQGIPVEIDTARSRDVPGLVREGSARIGITFKPHLDSAFESRAFKGALMALCGPARKDGRTWTTGEIEGELGGWIIPEGSEQGLEFLRKVLGREPKISILVKTYEEAVALARGGVGGTVSNSYALDASRASLAPCDLDGVEPPVFEGTIFWRGAAKDLSVFEQYFVDLFLRARGVTQGLVTISAT